MNYWLKVTLDTCKFMSQLRIINYLENGKQQPKARSKLRQRNRTQRTDRPNIWFHKYQQWLMWGKEWLPTIGLIWWTVPPTQTIKLLKIEQSRKFYSININHVQLNVIDINKTEHPSKRIKGMRYNKISYQIIPKKEVSFFLEKVPNAVSITYTTQFHAKPGKLPINNNYLNRVVTHLNPGKL